jgi:ornithine carbamoyltransferase
MECTHFYRGEPMKVRHFLTLKEYSGKEIANLIDRAISIKGHKERYANALQEKTLTMIFQKTSTRTRISFEAGMTQLGGHAIFLDWMRSQFAISDLEDETKVVARYSDLVMARLIKTDDLNRMARVCTVPLINGLDAQYHPCQIVGDLMTLKEKKGSLKGLKLTYIGIANNISNTLTVGCTKLGMEFTLCAPERHPPSLDKEMLREAKATGLYREEPDPKKAVKGADAVYTDTWIDMELFSDPSFAKEKERRIKAFIPYQVNRKLLQGSKALIMHDLPAHRGYEIDDWAMSAPNSIIFDQAENRLHAQKAIMLMLLGK